MHLLRTLSLGLVMMIALLTSHTTAAQDIETLVMPGEVIKGHFEFESECSSCHKLFDKEGQRQLCLDCHEEVAADFEQQTGFHGLRAEVRNDQCAACHTEHEGRDGVIVIMDEETFDHRFTDFHLEGPHADADCADCHAPEVKHREAPSECVDCHFEDQPHQEVMGTECGSCHQPTEWLEAEFDHDETDYPLLGKHREATCLDCHEDRTFPSPATYCFGCHSSDDQHEGRNGEECETCHNPRDWTDTSFDHQRGCNVTTATPTTPMLTRSSRSVFPAIWKMTITMPTTARNAAIATTTRTGPNRPLCMICKPTTRSTAHTKRCSAMIATLKQFSRWR